jgi:hypothetical protein
MVLVSQEAEAWLRSSRPTQRCNSRQTQASQPAGESWSA